MLLTPHYWYGDTITEFPPKQALSSTFQSLKQKAAEQPIPEHIQKPFEKRRATKQAERIRNKIKGAEQNLLKSRAAYKQKPSLIHRSQ